MKTKKLICLVAIIGLLFLVFGCKKDNADENLLTEFAITGDSGLKVQNDTSTDAFIYFDDKYIGIVGSGKSRSWNVPTGNHTFRGKVSGYNDIVRTDEYSPRSYVSIRLYIEIVLT